jgi:hypothetical protein
MELEVLPFVEQPIASKIVDEAPPNDRTGG